MVIIFLRFSLALNRFIVITDYRILAILKLKIVHIVFLVTTAVLLLGLIILAILLKDTYVISFDNATWNYRRINEIAQLETIFATGFTPVSFVIYICTGVHVFMIRSKVSASGLTEIRLLISCASGFFYEMCEVILFHYVLPNIERQATDYAICVVFWILLPAFNGVMLLWLNQSFRKRFFSRRWHSFELTSAVFVRTSSVSPRS
ncbi:hypothetical protein L596_019853 [Steinernema carpocapsae]|uniref:Uncharacterized protein n=1 Tax=Steinernema carpocapsae TaxID=34508 RepID=A0A4U5MRU1_STECR|nr:hypothetical protein L596_019853 [Steinernema carpocapsae]